MKKIYLEAYEFYKRQHPGCVILFHIGNSYYAFEDDAFVVADAVCLAVLYDPEEKYHWYDFHQDELEMTCYMLRNKFNQPVTTVDYRDEDGSFNIPKVKQILQDMEDDY